MPFGDIDALEAAMDDNTVAVLLEPIQGEGGVHPPPPGYLAALRALCSASGVLMIADEIQSGLGRAGATFACDLEDVVPDIYILGKALGGGMVPVSAIAADRRRARGDHPRVARVDLRRQPAGGGGRAEVVAMLATGEFQQRARTLGALLAEGLATLPGDRVVEVRTAGLWAGIDVDPDVMSGRTLARGC